MSTKATRATLQIVLDRLEDNLSEEGLSRAQRESYEHQLSLARESLSEVEAIEKAATVLRDSTKAKEVIAAQALFFKIAEEAP